MQRIEVEETLIARSALDTADELFLTSSWLGIMPAASLEGRALPTKKVSTHLLNAYRKDVEK
jgi:branched-subunit amino acid aminotransferase/4-amino-4-deoxychorismate lyase